MNNCKKFLSGLIHIKASAAIAVAMLVGGMVLTTPTFADNPMSTQPIRQPGSSMGAFMSS